MPVACDSSTIIIKLNRNGICTRQFVERKSCLRCVPEDNNCYLWHMRPLRQYISMLFPSIMMGILIVGCQRPADDPVKPANPSDNDKSIVIMYENDVHCKVDGYAAFAGLRDAISDTAYVATVSCGDFIQGGYVGTFSRGEYIIDIMNAVGYDAVTIGNHEFDYRVPRMLELTKRLSAPVVCANLTDHATGKQVFSSYVIKQMGKKKVAFVGLLTPSTVNSESYAFYDDDGNRTYDIEDENLNSLVQKAVDAARGEGADYVILLSHMGHIKDSCLSTSETVIQGTTGIDVVIDGHTHTVLYGSMVQNAAGQKVLLTQTGSKFKNVGKLTISRSGVIRSECLNTEYITQKSGKVQKAIDDVMAKCDDLMESRIAYSPFPLSIAESGYRIVRSRESNLGDLIADAFRITTGAEVGMMNGGGISVSIPAGDITWRHIYDCQPFGNSLCVIKATGQQIMDHLEVCSVYCPNENGSFMQVSGLQYTVNTSAKADLYIKNGTHELYVDGDRRVTNVKVLAEDGKYHPINLKQTYTVATINYIAGTQDTFPCLSVCEHVEDDIMPDVDCIGSYISSFGGTVPEQYRSTQGRILVK